MRRMPQQSGNTKSKGNGAQTGALSTHLLSQQDCRFRKVLYHISPQLSSPKFRKEDKNMKTNRTMEELLRYLESRKTTIEKWNTDNDLDKADTITGVLLERAFVGQGAGNLMSDLLDFLNGKKEIDDEYLV